MKMKGLRAMRTICASLLVGALCASGADDFAFTYRGRINPRGVTIPETLDVAFSLYAEPMGGTAAWTGTLTVRPATNGFFQCQLSGDGLAAAFTNANARYLGVAIGGEAEQYPRQEVLATAEADFAATADGLVSGGTAEMIEASSVTASSFRSVETTISKTLDISGPASAVNVSNLRFSDLGTISLKSSRLSVLKESSPAYYRFSSMDKGQKMFTAARGGFVTMMSTNSFEWDEDASCITWAVGPGDVVAPFSFSHEVVVYFYSFGTSN